VAVVVVQVLRIRLRRESLMFGGMNPRQWRALQQEAMWANELEKYHRPMIDSQKEYGDAMRLWREATRVNEERNQVWQALPPESARRSLQALTRTIKSSGLRRQIEGTQRALEAARTHLGPEALVAALYVIPSDLGLNEAFEAGFEQATDKIKEGRADEVLAEGTALASNPQVLGAIERSDPDALVEGAARRLDQGERGFEGVPRAEIDVETVITSAELTQDKLQAMEYYAKQVVRVLFIDFSVSFIAVNPVLGIAQILTTLGALGALLGFVEDARARRRDS